MKIVRKRLLCPLQVFIFKMAGVSRAGMLRGMEANEANETVKRVTMDDVRIGYILF
jgi:hypothetical protein